MRWDREHGGSGGEDKLYDALRDLPDWLRPHADEVLAELFDNARRAGATRIEVTIGPDDPGGCRLAVEDDGAGIADPQVIATYGDSGWPNGTAGLPPTGKGLFRLAAGTTTIASQAAGGAPWRTRLAPGTLTGEGVIEVETAAGRKRPGTRIGWQIPAVRNKATWRGAATEAARLMPIPVIVNGTPVGQAHPLSGADRQVNIDGVMIGLYGPSPHPPGGDDINDHGRRLEGRLPIVSRRNGSNAPYVWYARGLITSDAAIRADRTQDSYTIRDDPARRRLAAKVRRLLYEESLAQMAKQGVGIDYHDWEQAERAGATRGQPIERLRRWESSNVELVRHGSAVLDTSRVELDRARRATLKRALALHDDEPAIMEGSERARGYPWYRALPQITEIWVAAETGGVRRNATFDAAGRHQADAIEVVIEMETADGWRSRRLLRTDMAACQVQGRDDEKETRHRDRGPGGRSGRKDTEARGRRLTPGRRARDLEETKRRRRSWTSASRRCGRQRA